MSRAVRLGDVAVINPTLAAEVRTRDLATDVPFLAMAAVSEDGASDYSEKRALGSVLKGYTSFSRGDVILAKITPCFENGKAAHLADLPSDIGFGSTEFHVLRPGPEIDGRYLFHLVHGERFRNAGERNMTGSAGQKRVPMDFLRSFQIELPTLAEQRRIADLLDRADAVQRKREASRRLVDELLRSVFLEMFGDPVRNEKGWEVVPARQVITDTQYGTATKANNASRGLPVLRMNNITYSGQIDLSDLKSVELAERDLAKLTVRRGDLLFNRTNSPELVGKAAVWDRDEEYAFAGYLVRVRLDDRSALPEYVSAVLNSESGKALLRATAKPSNNMSNISATAFGGLRIPLPPLALQERFRRVVFAVRSLADRFEGAGLEGGSLADGLSVRLLAKDR